MKIKYPYPDLHAGLAADRQESDRQESDLLHEKPVEKHVLCLEPVLVVVKTEALPHEKTDALHEKLEGLHEKLEGLQEKLEAPHEKLETPHEKLLEAPHEKLLEAPHAKTQQGTQLHGVHWRYPWKSWRTA